MVCVTVTVTRFVTYVLVRLFRPNVTDLIRDSNCESKEPFPKSAFEGGNVSRDVYVWLFPLNATDLIRNSNCESREPFPKSAIWGKTSQETGWSEHGFFRVLRGFDEAR